MSKKIYLVFYIGISAVIFASIIRYCCLKYLYILEADSSSLVANKMMDEGKGGILKHDKEKGIDIQRKLSVDKIESVIEDSFPLKENMREFYGTVNKILNPYEISKNGGSTVRDLDGFLQPITMNSFDIIEAGRGIVELRDTCEKDNIDFLYVSYPSKNSSLVSKEYYGIDTNAKEMRINFLEGLDKNGVDILNIGQLMEAKGYTTKDLFYKTDHHWKTEAGLFAAREISKYLQYNFGYNMNSGMLKNELFSYRKYEECWLGETGRKCSKTWTGSLDDFTEITPVYNTFLEYSSNGKNSVKGDFHILLDENAYKEKGDLYNTNMHYTYMNGAGNIAEIRNLNNTDGPKILLIKDSFSVVVMPFLSLTCQDIVWWDMRENDNSLYDYIQENDFDIVLLAYTDFWRSDLYYFY